MWTNTLFNLIRQLLCETILNVSVKKNTFLKGEEKKRLQQCT